MVTNTTKTLRDTLLSELDDLVNGKITASRARATASLAKAAISSAQFELQHASHVANMGSAPTPVKL